MARELYEATRYWDAIQQLEPLVPRTAGATRAQARLLLARAYLKNPLWKKRAEGLLQATLDDNPRDLAACLLLAELYREARLPSRARSLYQKALAIEPGHAAAREALEALEPPPVSEPSRGVAGLFRRR
jgi:tetratricopeptide (TPR) repeat protein